MVQAASNLLGSYVFLLPKESHMLKTLRSMNYLRYFFRTHLFFDLRNKNLFVIMY